jgi:hypothetical protein
MRQTKSRTTAIAATGYDDIQFLLFSISEEKAKIFSNYACYVSEQKNLGWEQKIDGELPGLYLLLLGGVSRLSLLFSKKS